MSNNANFAKTGNILWDWLVKYVKSIFRQVIKHKMKSKSSYWELSGTESSLQFSTNSLTSCPALLRYFGHKFNLWSTVLQVIAASDKVPLFIFKEITRWIKKMPVF